MSCQIAFHRAKDRQQFVFFLLRNLELIQCSHQIAYQRIEFGIGNLHAGVGFQHGFAFVLTRATRARTDLIDQVATQQLGTKWVG